MLGQFRNHNVKAIAQWASALSGSGLRRDQRGGVMITMAFALPVLVLAAGMAIDYAAVTGERSKVQHAADAAALAGAKELSLSEAGSQSVTGVVEAVIAANVPATKANGGTRDLTVASKLINDPGTPMQVEVYVSETFSSPFGSRFGLSGARLDVKSVAVVIGKPNICLLALDPSAMGTIYLQKTARIVGQNCAVYSNSTHPNGIKAFNSSKLSASTICSAGGKAGNQGNFQPDPLTDCPQFSDPLAGRPEPAVGSCIETNLVVTNQTVELGPGTYCGGVSIKGTSRVSFRPGVYAIKDGPLLVADTAVVEGVNVGFYFTGQLARFSFSTGSSISFTAPKDGEMASLLFFASRAQSNVRYDILSDNARQLLGTIYLPTGTLTIDANQPIADLSAYTAIVARSVQANAGPTITLNTNYSQTDIPVPDGIRAAGMPVALSK